VITDRAKAFGAWMMMSNVRREVAAGRFRQTEIGTGARGFGDSAPGQRI
jgi:hypothetical protein